jgi:hypothetical protein
VSADERLFAWRAVVVAVLAAARAYEAQCAPGASSLTRAEAARAELAAIRSARDAARAIPEELRP